MSMTVVLAEAEIMIEQFKKQMCTFDSEIKTRAVKEVLEEDRHIVKDLTSQFVAFLRECGTSCLGEGSVDSVPMKVISLFEQHEVAIFTGPAFNGLECKMGDVLLKVHLFPPDADETLWHNHGQNFFSSAIGRSGKYWHRFGELQQDGDKKTSKFEKQAKGDPRFQGEESGSIKTMIAHAHQEGSVCFIHSRAKHTVQAEHGTGPVLTCVVQATEKTNTTTIFKDDQEPIKENFRERDKDLPVEKRLDILRAIAVELVGTEAQHQFRLTPQMESKQTASPSREGGAVGWGFPVHLTCVIAKGDPSRLPQSVEVRCVLCNVVTANRSALNEHECSVHMRTGFKCSCCSRSFRTSEDLRRHSRSTSHAIPAMFQWARHILDNSGSLESSTSSSEDEMAGTQQRTFGSLPCSQAYRISESTHVGTRSGPVAA